MTSMAGSLDSVPEQCILTAHPDVAGSAATAGVELFPPSVPQKPLPPPPLHAVAVCSP